MKKDVDPLWMKTCSPDCLLYLYIFLHVDKSFLDDDQMFSYLSLNDTAAQHLIMCNTSLCKADNLSFIMKLKSVLKL